MRVGLIARAEDRGLGHLCWEMARALEPAQVLVVAMGQAANGFTSHPERYMSLGGEVTVMPREDMGGQSRELMRFIRRSDVIYSAETFYDWGFCKRARNEGVRTVCHVMPEFWNHWRDDFHEAAPDAWWLPTPWYEERFPKGTPIVPVPVPMDRWPEPVELNKDRPLRVLHTAGHRAAMDRNGTLAFFAALRKVRADVEVTVISQASRLPHPSVPRNVKYRVVLNGARDYWSMYADHDVLVLPRRYGGLSLPVQQAAGAGLALVLPDIEPNAWYPALLTKVVERDVFPCAIGDMPVAVPDALSIAQTIDRLAEDRHRLGELQQCAREWAEEHAWSKLAPTYLDELAKV